MQKYLDEVEGRLLELAADVNPHKAAERARYMKVVMPLLGLPVPMQRNAAKRVYSFTHLPIAKQLPIWDYIWKNARTHEAKCQPLYYLMQLDEQPAATLWPVLRGWGRQVNCWDQSDYLSKLFNDFLGTDPAIFLAEFENWTDDEHPWRRRIGLVSLFGFGGKRDWYPPVQTVLRMVEHLLGDEGYYVQKGLGWCLRECYLVYPQETLWFLSDHAATLAPAAWQAATEKLSKSEKTGIKALRKSARVTKSLKINLNS